MVAKILIVASVFGVLSLTNAASAPFITPCKASDAECAKRNAIKSIPLFADGIPELGVKTLDPLFFKSVDASSPNLKFILKDLKLKGLKNCVPIKVQRDVAKSNIVVKLSCALNLEGEYEMSGQVLILKIIGQGKIYVFVPQLEIEAILDVVEKEGKDGEKHIRIKKFHHSYELKDESNIVFEGLFPDNEVLRQAANDMVKKNGNAVINEIGGKVFETVITECVENFNNFFGRVPLSLLALD